MPFLIRKATINDIDSMINLFVDTVTHINSHDYSNEQIKAWTQDDDRSERWKQKLDEQYVILAEKHALLVGFSCITKTGYLDLLFVHRDFQRRGIAKQLLHQLEIYAKTNNLLEITSDASITARPFFERNGFAVVEERIFDKRGTSFNNYRMIKHLTP